MSRNANARTTFGGMKQSHWHQTCNALTVNGFAKGRLLSCERRPFSVRFTAFWKTKGRLLQTDWFPCSQQTISKRQITDKPPRTKRLNRPNKKTLKILIKLRLVCIFILTFVANKLHTSNIESTFHIRQDCRNKADTNYHTD